MVYLIFAVGLYAVYCGVLFFYQTKLMFPVGMAGKSGDALPTVQTEVIELPTDQGTTTAWFVPSLAASTDNPAPLAVFFHGNAELMDHQRAIIDLYHALGVSVLMVEYRGYGHSAGTPSEKHILSDTVAVLDEVLRRGEVDPDRLVLHGRSIGGGLAAQVALKREPAALIVESTSRSVAGMAWQYGVPPFLVTSPLRTERAFKKLDVPILVMHAKHDAIFPVEHAHKLDAAARQSTLVLFDADHNTLPGPQEIELYVLSVAEHLKQAGVVGARSVSE